MILAAYQQGANLVTLSTTEPDGFMLCEVGRSPSMYGPSVRDRHDAFKRFNDLVDRYQEQIVNKP